MWIIFLSLKTPNFAPQLLTWKTDEHSVIKSSDAQARTNVHFGENCFDNQSTTARLAKEIH